MPSLDFFRNVHVIEPNFFDEGPKVQTTKQAFVEGEFHNTSSIATNDIDGYRQGVELTQLKHFDAGIVKIHAGEPGHVLRRNRFGMDKNFRNDPRFEELDYFDPVKFLEAQDRNSTFFSVVTFPIITSDNDQIENFLFDGVIEPFTIRSRASFFSIDIPFEAHDIKGALMGGNIDGALASDQVQTEYRYDLRQNLAFLDQYAESIVVGDEAVGQGHASSIVGFFTNNRSTLTPFTDARFPRNTTLSTNYDATMDAALSLMTGSTENYLNMIINKRSATAGWDYDSNTGIGTDSLAFGGRVF